MPGAISNNMEVDLYNNAVDHELQAANDLSDPNVMTKYRMAADIANSVMDHLVKRVVAGASVLELCQHADEMIMLQTSSCFKKNKGMEKGVAFPTSINVNNIVMNYSPMKDDQTTLADGDVVSMCVSPYHGQTPQDPRDPLANPTQTNSSELGVHIDGYIATLAHTTIVNVANSESPITGRKADLIAATFLAHELCSRIIRVGRKASDLTETIQRVANIFQVTPVLDVYSTPLERFVFDSDSQRVPSFVDPLNPVDEPDFAFEENTAYQVNVCMTLGNGRTKEVPVMSNGKSATIYQRNAAVNYNCRVKASRQLLSEIETRFGAMPFTMRSVNSTPALQELLSHNLLLAHPTLATSDLSANFKSTILLLPGGASPLRLTSSDAMPYIMSEHGLEEDAVLEKIWNCLNVRTVPIKKEGAADSNMDI